MFEAYNPHLDIQQLRDLRSTSPRIWPPWTVPVFAPYSATDKSNGYCQVRWNANMKLSCHRVTLAEYYAQSWPACTGMNRCLDVSHRLECGESRI